MYACIRWADMEPNEKDDDSRVWIHHPDCDEVRSVIGHKEYPPDGYYEQYKIRIERYSLDDSGSKFVEGDDDSEDYKTTSVKTLRTKYKRKNSKKEIYVKRRRNAVSDRWIDGVELKVFEIRDYWIYYYNQRRQRIEQNKLQQPTIQKQQAIQHPLKRSYLSSNQGVGDSRHHSIISTSNLRNVVQQTQKGNYVTASTPKCARIVNTARCDNYTNSHHLQQNQILHKQYSPSHLRPVDYRTSNEGEIKHAVHQDHVYYQQPSTSCNPQKRFNSSPYCSLQNQLSPYQHRPTPRSGGSSAIFSRTPSSSSSTSTPMYRQIVVRQQHQRQPNSESARGSEYYDQYGRLMETVYFTQQPQHYPSNSYGGNGNSSRTYAYQ